jgi:hypothetical protein
MADDLPEEKTITLRKPVTLGSETWSSLTLREPTAAEWMQFDKLSGIEADIKAISLISGVPEPAVRQIGARDIIEASKYLAGFLS